MPTPKKASRRASSAPIGGAGGRGIQSPSTYNWNPEARLRREPITLCVAMLNQ